MQKRTITIVMLIVLASGASLAYYFEYKRRSAAFYACADQSQKEILRLHTSGDKFYVDNDFFFADKGAHNAEPDETRGYKAYIVYDIGYTPERLILMCYVRNGIVNNIEIMGKVIPEQK